MSANLLNILSGVAGGGTAGSAPAFIAPLGTTLPTTPTMALDAGFLDPGWVTSDGLQKSVAESSTEIDAYGSTQPVRILTTSSKVTFDIAFLETNPVTQAVYQRLPLASVVADGSGIMAFGEGAARTVNYAGVFHIVDGVNIIRAVVPNMQVTDRQSFSAKAGAAITYGVTFTAYPGSDGDAVKWYLLVPSTAV